MKNVNCHLVPYWEARVLAQPEGFPYYYCCFPDRRCPHYCHWDTQKTGLQRAIKAKSMHHHKFSKWHPFIEPIKQVIYDTIKSFCNLNLENKCDKPKVKKQFTVISNLIHLQLSSVTSPLGKQWQWRIKFMRKRRRLPDSLYLYI